MKQELKKVGGYPLSSISSKIKHKWNNYSQFRIEVQKKEIDEGWLKLAKEFIEKYKTKIKKDLKERKILIE
ncbi:hypothetical protein L8F19_03990 [Mycoplasmopsis bovis]|nr:hypothetical protein L8F19_03990 [Mycoplasmopsis bovis]